MFFAPALASSIPWGKIIVGLVILGLAGAVVWYRHEAAAARETAKAAQDALAIWRGSAERWQEAAEERGQLIESQNAEIEAARADMQRASRVIAEAQAAARKASETAEAQIRQWRDRARANPNQTVPLGSIARDAVKTLVNP